MKSAESTISFKDWRRERDSNPQCGFPYSGFQDHRHRPLGHPSAFEIRPEHSQLPHNVSVGRSKCTSQCNGRDKASTRMPGTRRQPRVHSSRICRPTTWPRSQSVEAAASTATTRTLHAYGRFLSQPVQRHRLTATRAAYVAVAAAIRGCVTTSGTNRASRCRRVTRQTCFSDGQVPEVLGPARRRPNFYRSGTSRE